MRYEMVEDWAKLPTGWRLGDVTGLAVDARDRVYLFCRGPNPIVVMDVDGNVDAAFGHGDFTMPHAIQVTPEGEILATDANAHMIRKYGANRQLQLTLGTPGQHSELLSNKPFNRPTHTASAPNGDIYVADGYCNATVHRYTASGDYLTSWPGRSGTGPGEFNVVHNIACDDAGQVYIADRENHRLQVFDGEGNYLRQINNLHRPAGLWFGPGAEPLIYVAEFGPPLPVNRRFTGLGARVSVLDNAGNLFARIGGDRPAAEPGSFVAPHAVAADSQGNIYVGDVGNTMWKESFPDSTPPEDFVTIQKFRLVTE